jgi:hypothetical protein
MIHSRWSLRPTNGRLYEPTIGIALVLATLLASRAQAACDGGPAVDLSVELLPRDESVRDALERQLAAELATHAIDLCRVLPGNPQVLAHVRLQAPLPGLSPALVRIRTPGASVVRSLDLTTLPHDARPAAVASSVDELLRSLLANPPAAEPDAPPSDPASSVAGHQPRAAQRPIFEIGAAGAASTFFEQRDALGADLRARYWLSSNVALSTRAGACSRWSRPPERGEVQAKGDVHAGIGAAYGFLPWTSHLQLLAEAGLNLARVGFDEQPSELFAAPAAPNPAVGPVQTPRPDPLPVERYALDQAWSLVGRLGVEARYRIDSLGLSMALVGLVPIVRAESDWGDSTSLSHTGAELSLGFWFALGQREASQ